jgi:hypothetical protein
MGPRIERSLSKIAHLSEEVRVQFKASVEECRTALSSRAEEND